MNKFSKIVLTTVLGATLITSCVWANDNFRKIEKKELNSIMVKKDERIVKIKRFCDKQDTIKAKYIRLEGRGVYLIGVEIPYGGIKTLEWIPVVSEGYYYRGLGDNEFIYNNVYIDNNIKNIELRVVDRVQTKSTLENPKDITIVDIYLPSNCKIQ